MKNKTERGVIITTDYKGVFFGMATDTDGETIKLTQSRNVIYWSADLRGFMGLATNGPSVGCKIGPSADITLRKITAVVECTPLAVERWLAAK